MRQRRGKSRRVAKRHLLGRDEQLQHIIPGKPIEDPSAFLRVFTNPASFRRWRLFEVVVIAMPLSWESRSTLDSPCARISSSSNLRPSTKCLRKSAKVSKTSRSPSCPLLNEAME